MCDDLVGVFGAVEARPGQQEFGTDRWPGVFHELCEVGHGGVRSDPGGRDHDVVGVHVVELLRAREQAQEQRADLRQGAGLLRVRRGDEGGGARFDGRAYSGVEGGGVLEAGGGEQVDAGAGALVGGFLAAGEEVADDGDAFGGTGEGDRHPDDVLPLVVVGTAGEEPEVAFLDRRPRAQEVLEGAVDELHRVGSRFPQEPAALEEVLEDDGRVTQGGRFLDRRQCAGDDLLGAGTVHLRAAVLDQPVREALQQVELWLLPQVRDRHVAFAVAAAQQHGQGGLVEVLAAVREVAVPVAVEGADQSAHQGVGGQASEIGLGPYGGEELGLVRPEFRVGLPAVAGGGVPPLDEGGDLRPAHGGQGQLGEVLLCEPVRADRGGARGDEPAVVPVVGVHQVPQPAAGAFAFRVGDLVDAVDEDEAAAGQEDAVGPAVGLGGAEGTAGGGQEVPGGGQPFAVAGERAQWQDEGDAVVEVLHLRGEVLPGGGDGQPLDEGGLAGPGFAAEQYPGVVGQGLVGGSWCEHLEQRLQQRLHPSPLGAPGQRLPGRGRRRGRHVLAEDLGERLPSGGGVAVHRREPGAQLGGGLPLEARKRRGLEAQVGRVQGPAGRGVGEVDAVDGQPAVLLLHVREVQLLERGVLGSG